MPFWPDKYQLREIEKQLAHELQVASQLVRTACSETERQKAIASYDALLKVFADFCAKGIIPERFTSRGA